MADLDLAWTGPSQVALTSSVSQGAQYQQVGLALHDGFLAAGWTIPSSGNGAGTAGAGDNIAVVADIVHAIAGSAHSWFVAVPPVGKGSPAGSEYAVLVDFIEAAGDATPQLINIYLARGTYAGGTNTNRPTITGTEAAAALAHNLIPWAAPGSGSFCVWTTDAGDLYFAVKADADLFFRNLFIATADATNGLGNFRMAIFGASAAAADAITISNLTAAANWKYFLGDGTNPGALALSTKCTIHIGTIWANSGQEATSGRRIFRDVELITSVATANNQRVLGLLRDVRGVAGGTPFNDVDTADNGNSLPFVLRVAGALALPCDAAIT